MDTPGNMDIYLRYCQGRVAKLRLTVIVNTHIHTLKKKKLALKFRQKKT